MLRKKLTTLEKNIENLKESRNTLIIPKPLNLPSPKIKQVKTAFNFDWNLIYCTKKDTKMTCHFSIKNTGKDTIFTIYKKIIFYNERGKSFSIGSVVMIDEVFSLKEHSYVYNKIISNVPIILKLVFENIPEDTMLITLLDIQYSNDKVNGINRHLEFRNIAITPE